MFESAQPSHILPRPLSFSLNKESFFPFINKIYPKHFSHVDLTSWGSNLQNCDKIFYKILKHQKHAKSFNFNLDEYKNHGFFLKCLKLFRTSSKSVEIQKPSHKPLLKQFHRCLLNSRLEVVSGDSSILTLKLIRSLKSIKVVTLNFNSLSNESPKMLFLKLARIIKRASVLQVCNLKNIKEKNQTLEEVINLVTNSRNTIHFVIELKDIPLSSINKLSHLKERISLCTRLTAIDQSPRPENDFSFVKKLDVSLRFGFNINEISNIVFLEYMHNLRQLDMSLRFKDLGTINLNDLFRVIKFPRQLRELNLELHDLHFKPNTLQMNQSTFLTNLNELKQAIETLKKEDPISNFIREFEELKNLTSFRILFSGEEDNPMFYLLIYTIIKQLSNLKVLDIKIEISRGLTKELRFYYELNFTYILALLQNSGILKQVWVAVPIISFRKTERIPSLVSLEKIFLHCTKEPIYIKECSEYAERLFEAISETNVRDVYLYFKNDIICEEWLKIFIETGKFPRIERIFLGSNTEGVDVDLFEAVCFFLREKKSLVKMVLNFAKCNISPESMNTCLEFIEENKRLNHAIISVKNGNIVNNKPLKQSSFVIF